LTDWRPCYITALTEKNKPGTAKASTDPVLQDLYASDNSQTNRRKSRRGSRGKGGRRRRTGDREDRKMRRSGKLLVGSLVLVLASYLIVLMVSFWRQPDEASRASATPATTEPTDTEQAATPEPVVVVEPVDIETDLNQWRQSLRVWRAARAEAARLSPAAAIAYLEEAAEEAPPLPALQWELAQRYVNAGRYAEAEPLLQALLAIDPEREGLRVMWGETLLELRAYNQAIALAVWMLEDDQLVAKPNEIAALAFLGLNQPERAIPFLHRQLTRDREDLQALNNLATAYTRAGRHDEAVNLLRGILEKEPENATAYYNLAASYANHGETAAAIDVLGQAINRFGYVFVSAWLTSEDFAAISDTTAFQSLQPGQIPAQPAADEPMGTETEMKEDVDPAEPVTEESVSGETVVEETVIEEIAAAETTTEEPATDAPAATTNQLSDLD
jgi:Flp pilus assembly protein TadD